MWTVTEIILIVTAFLTIIIIACAAKFQRLIQEYTFGSGLVAGESFKEITPAMRECPSSPSLLSRSSTRLNAGVTAGVKAAKSKLGKKLFRSSNNLNLKMTPLSEAVPEELTDDVRKELKSIDIGGVNFSGTWAVNRERSSCLDKHLEALGVPWIARVVAKNSKYTSEIDHTGLWWQEKTTTSVVSTTQEMRLDGRTQSEPHPMDSSECICETRLITNPSLENSFSATFSSHSLSTTVTSPSAPSQTREEEITKIETTSMKEETSEVHLMPEVSPLDLNENSFETDDVGFAFIDVEMDDLGDQVLSNEINAEDTKTSTWRPLPDILKPPSPPPIPQDMSSSDPTSTSTNTSATITNTNSIDACSLEEESGYPKVVTRTLFRKNGLNQVVSRWLEKKGTSYVVKNELFLSKSDTVLTAILYFDLVTTTSSLNQGD